MHHNRPQLHLDLFPLPRQIISALAVDQDGAIGGRGLVDWAGEARQHRFYLRQRRSHSAGRDHCAFQVQRVGLRAEGDREVVNLVAVEHPSGELGRFADRDRQDAGRQRIERAAMADLAFASATVAQRALDRCDGLRRAKAMRFVENDPAVHCAPL